MTEAQIVAILTRHGFQVTGSRGWSTEHAKRPARLEHPSETQQGSLYVADNYVSATGPFKDLRDEAPATGLDRKGCPYWQGEDLRRLLLSVGVAYAKGGA